MGWSDALFDSFAVIELRNYHFLIHQQIDMDAVSSKKCHSSFNKPNLSEGNQHFLPTLPIWLAISGLVDCFLSPYLYLDILNGSKTDNKCPFLRLPFRLHPLQETSTGSCLYAGACKQVVSDELRLFPTTTVSVRPHPYSV